MHAAHVQEGSEDVDDKCHPVHDAQIGASLASILPVEMSRSLHTGHYYQDPKEEQLWC